MLHARARALGAMRRFFDSRGVIEVQTPLLVRSPGVEPHLDAFSVQPGQRFLNTSPEYHMKRLLAAGSGPIYQLATTFRAGERGERHNPEFSMLEWYRPHGGYLDLLEETQALLVFMAEALGRGPHVRCGDQVVDLETAPEVLTVHEAFQRHAGVNLDDLQGPDRLADYSLLMVENIEPKLGQGKITALIDYPIDMASLARKKPENQAVAERLEIYVGGLELANAFTELVDPVEQRARMEAERVERLRLGKPELPIDERFLEALDACPPCAGIALGFDRLLMLLLEKPTIDDVVAFPWDDV